MNKMQAFHIICSARFSSGLKLLGRRIRRGQRVRIDASVWANPRIYYRRSLYGAALGIAAHIGV